MQAQVGSSNLQISTRTAAGATIDLSRTVEILPAHYRTSALTVAPKFVEPGPEEMTRIKAERALKNKVFATSATAPLWSGDFRAPVHAAPTDSFGTRRIFNGKLASIHQGMDFRAATGTPVRAGNSGVVVLAQALYYEGNCVVIDHGLGLFTIEAIQNQDLPEILGVTMLAAFFIVIANLVVDVLYAFVDPRVRH